jgi:hypothetical protein
VANKFLFCFSRGIQEVFAGKREEDYPTSLMDWKNIWQKIENKFLSLFE